MHHSGSLNLGGNVYASVGDQRLGQAGLHGAAGPYHIQNGDHDGLRAAQPLQGGEDALQRVALDTDKNDVGLLVIALLFKCGNGDGKGTVAGLQHQAVFFNGIPVGAPGNEGDILSAHGQEGGQTASRAAGAVYKVLHKSLQAVYNLFPVYHAEAARRNTARPGKKDLTNGRNGGKMKITYTN